MAWYSQTSGLWTTLSNWNGAAVGEVSARVVPATATEFTLRVSGPGMQSITATPPRNDGATELSKLAVIQ
jgi:hypothetical protein